MLVGGSASVCCCLLRRETKHSVWGVLPASKGFGYVSAPGSCVHQETVLCKMRCQWASSSLRLVEQAWVLWTWRAVWEAEFTSRVGWPWASCRCPVLFCAGGPPSGSSSVPRAPCLEVACSKAREWEGSAAFCLLYAVLTIFACSLVVAAYKCEVRRVHCSYSKWQQPSSAPVSSIDNGNTLACRTNKRSFSKQLNKTLVTSWVFVVSALNDICPRSGFEQNCFSMNGMKKSPNRAFVQLHMCIINVFYVVCFDLSLRAECWNDQRPGAIWEGFQLCCT